MSVLARKGRFAQIVQIPGDTPEIPLLRAMSGIDQQMDELYRQVNSLRDRATALERTDILAGYTLAMQITPTFTAAGVDTTFSHGMGVPPLGLLQLRLAANKTPAVVYFGSILPTALLVTLRSTVIGSQVVVLFA